MRKNFTLHIVDLILEASIEPVCYKEVLIFLLASGFQNWKILKVILVKFLHHLYFSLDCFCLKAHLTHNMLVIRIIYTTSYATILATSHRSIYNYGIRYNHETLILWQVFHLNAIDHIG